MKLTKISLVAAMVLGGLLACSNLALAQDASNGHGKKGHGTRGVDQRVERLDKAVSLTDEQKPKVKALFEEEGKKMAATRDLSGDERTTKRREIMKEQNKKLKDILTPDQFKKYQQVAMHHGKGKRGQNTQSDSSSSK